MIDASRPLNINASKYHVGQLVLVKPPNARCTSRWTTGRLTNIHSDWKVDVDGIPRHTKDVRAHIERRGSPINNENEENGDESCDGDDTSYREETSNEYGDQREEDDTDLILYFDRFLEFADSIIRFIYLRQSSKFK